MIRNHRVQINVANNTGQIERVLESHRISLPERLLKLLVGNFCEVLVLTPSASVQNIEIHEVSNGDTEKLRGGAVNETV